MRKKIQIILVLLPGIWMWTPQTVYAASSVLNLDVSPKLCVVDVIQDGAQQIVRSATSECETALPTLIFTPRATSEDSLQLPFAGNTVPGQLTAQPEGVAGKWSPLVSNQEKGVTAMSGSQLTALFTGLTVTTIVTAIVLDVALFELRFSRTTLKLVRQAALRYVPKR